MTISIISFTQNGIKLSKSIQKLLADVNVELYAKCSAPLGQNIRENINFIDYSITEWAKVQMQSGKALVFIGACGIAVRAIAPYITNKLYDSPVIVMDELAHHVIPILSGHIGGANEIAIMIGNITGAEPVITTATDLNKKFSVDVFAKHNKLAIINKDGIAKVSSSVLSDREITMSIESDEIYIQMPKADMKIKQVGYPPTSQVDVLITTKSQDFAKFDAELVLMPKDFAIGMGCRRGKAMKDIEDFVMESLTNSGILPQQVFALASIDKKSDEKGFIEWSRKYNCPFVTYSATDLEQVEGDFCKSEFVKDKVGVDNVCERAAIKACNPQGTIIYEKHAKDGMTIAIAKRAIVSKE